MKHLFLLRLTCRPFSALGLLALIAGTVSAQTLDQTSVGRFGVGHAITPNTASQDLVAWNVVNNGHDLQLRMYDANGNPVSLGHCGLPAPSTSMASATIHDIGW